jgi:hypothetical protein
MSEKITLPTFLIADNSQETPENVYVVHTDYPRFIAQFELDDIEAEPVIFWFDEAPEDKNEIENFATLAFDFLMDEMESQDAEEND